MAAHRGTRGCTLLLSQGSCGAVAARVAVLCQWAGRWAEHPWGAAACGHPRRPTQGSPTRRCGARRVLGCSCSTRTPARPHRWSWGPGMGSF